MEHGAVEKDAVVGRRRERGGMEREASDPAGRQAAIERGRGIESPRIGAGLAQRVALAVAGEGEHQRRDERVDARLVDVPLVHAVLDDRSSGVQRGDVRGGRGGELRRELRDRPVGEHPTQERMALGVAREEAPAERVEEDEHDALDAVRRVAERGGRQAALASQQQARDGRRQGREAVPVGQWPHGPATVGRSGPPRAIDARDGGGVDRHLERRRLAEHLAQPLREREVALEVEAAGEQRLPGVEVAARPCAGSRRP